MTFNVKIFLDLGLEKPKVVRAGEPRRITKNDVY